MSILALIAAFGGGILGAYMGALPAFIMTGFVALAGGLIQLCGGDGSLATGVIAFGSFVGPHVAFAGGVAAAAYAGKIKKLENGADITTPLNGFADASIIIVGGIFGVIGYLINYVMSLPAVSAVFPTDTPGFGVMLSAIIVRLVFGSTGLLGKYTGSTPREWISKGNVMVYNIVLGAGIGVITGGLGGYLLDNAPEAAGIFPVVCFGFAAVSLVFAQTGFAVPGTHHIFLPSALAAVTLGGIFGSTAALIFGIIFGILTSIFGDFIGHTFNSHADSHIDPPAITIVTSTFIIVMLGRVLG